MMALSNSSKYKVLIMGIVGFIGLTLYPIAISPMMDSSEYSKIIGIKYNLLSLSAIFNCFFCYRKNTENN